LDSGNKGVHSSHSWWWWQAQIGRGGQNVEDRLGMTAVQHAALVWVSTQQLQFLWPVMCGVHSQAWELCRVHTV
jgi:hypothetical protein